MEAVTHASVVFTRDFSDWSTMPDLSDTAAVWWRAVHKKDSIETHCSRDGKSFTTICQGYFPPGTQVEIGIMCAAPEGPGSEALFDNLKLEVRGPYVRVLDTSAGRLFLGNSWCWAPLCGEARTQFGGERGPELRRSLSPFVWPSKRNLPESERSRIL